MGTTARKLKKGVKGVLLAWQLLIIVLLSALLIPLFLHSATSSAFYTWWVMLSILAYLILTYIQLRLREGAVKRYLESLATRVFLAVVALAVAFVTVALRADLWSGVFLVVAAVLYAAAFQKIAFLRVIGL